MMRNPLFSPSSLPPSLTSNAPRFKILAVAATLISLALACFISPTFHPDAAPYGGDFLQEWIGGYIVRTGQGAWLYDDAFTQQLQHDAKLVGAWDESRYFPFVYPPFYYVLVSPFSLLPFRIAAVVWAGRSLQVESCRLGMKPLIGHGDHDAVNACEHRG